MNITIGKTLAELRKSKKLMQKEVAANMSKYGFTVNPKTIYNWEKGLAQPSIPHFLALCDMLDVNDVLWQFAGISNSPYAGLNTTGRQKAREFIDILHQIDSFKTSATSNQRRVNSYINNSYINTVDTTYSPGRQDAAAEKQHEHSRIIRLYDIPVSAGGGNFLDESSYEEIEAPSYVPIAVDFALRVSGDSMNPLIRDGQVIWVKEQEILDNGEIGIFTYSGDVYCKKLITNGAKAYLRSLNPEYNDIEIKDDYGFKVIGKVVS